MSANNWDGEWLNFSRRARRGAFVFLFLFVIISMVPSLYWNYIYESDMDPKIMALNEKLLEQKIVDKESAKSFVPPGLFNPNDYSQEEWMAIGLSEKQAQTILNYLKKGGQLRVKEDVKKLYVIDDNMYDQLSPYIDLPSRDQRPKVASNYTPDSSQFATEENNIIISEDYTVNINMASKQELMKVKGVGDYYADQIIKRREAYGGIHALDQLMDLYKMTPDKLDSLRESLLINLDDIDRINVNSASKSKLMNHPLINADQANSIVFIRERFGKYKSLDGLLQSPYINQEKLKEIKPYLKVE